MDERSEIKRKLRRLKIREGILTKVDCSEKENNEQHTR